MTYGGSPRAEPDKEACIRRRGGAYIRDCCFQWRYIKALVAWNAEYSGT